MRISVRLCGYLWRPLTASEDDTEFALRVRNTPQARAAFFTPHVAREDHLGFLKRAEERGEINLIAEKGGERLGTGGIFNIDWKNRRAMGRTAVAVPRVHLLNVVVWMHIGFDVMGLHKLYAESLASNVVSNRSLERFGMTKEGTLREHVFIDGTPRDVCAYGVLASDWRRIRPGLLARFGEPEVRVHTAEDGVSGDGGSGG